MTQNIIITGNRHSQKHSNIMEMDPYSIAWILYKK